MLASAFLPDEAHTRRVRNSLDSYPLRLHQDTTQAANMTSPAEMESPPLVDSSAASLEKLKEAAEPPVPDYYAILGLTQHATEGAIKQVHRRLALQYLMISEDEASETDVNAVDFTKVSYQVNNSKYCEPSMLTLYTNVQEAYDVLRDRHCRSAYDKSFRAVQASWRHYRNQLQCWKEYDQEEQINSYEARKHPYSWQWK